MSRGEEVIGLFNSADAQTAAAIALYQNPPPKALPVARTLAADERLVITDVMMYLNGTAFDAALFWDADSGADVDAGETIARLKSADGGLAIAFNTPHYGPVGSTPKVKAGGAGAVDVVIHGFIIQS